MSGVVSPVVTWSSAVVTPSVPIEAERCPAMRHSWRDHFDRRGLAVGAGDGDDRLGKGREKLRRELGEQAARLGIGEMGSALDLRLGPGNDRDRAALDRRGDEILAVEAALPRKAPNTLPCATLR